MATSKPLLLLAASLPLIGAGCGGASRGGTSAGSPPRHAPVAGASASVTGPVSLQARAAPASWRSRRIPSGAVLFYPPGWRLTGGDSGTATAQTVDAGGRIVGYLNVTPRQSGETLAGWARFRITHNMAENERSVRLEAAITGVRFRSGVGNCVRDSYTTSIGARYVELACLVKGSKTSTVIVAAAPPGDWERIGPLLERSLSALLT